MNEQGVSRRRLLKAGAGVGLAALVLGGGGFALHSCQREGGLGLDFGQDGLDDPYEVWRQVQAGLRTSPDHTLGKARALVAAGDVAAIHRFVRDDIRLISAVSSYLHLGPYVKWGARAALRAGAGTAREKAEILSDLIRQTGRDAHVVELEEAGHEADNGIFYREFAPAFQPQVAEVQVERWRKALGQPELNVDVAARERETLQLARDLRGQIPAPEYERVARLRYTDLISGRVPVVRFTEPGQGDMYADPVRPDADLTPVGTTQEHKAREATGMLPVSVSLTATVLDEGVEPFEIARAEWTADEVAGRQVRIAFKPFGDTTSVLASRIDELRSFTPFLSIQALDGEVLDPERTVVIGESFTLEGDRITQSGEGVVYINGKPIGDGRPSGRAGDVASIDVEADGSRFPDMRLFVRPRGADGAIIDGLSGGEFALADEGEAVSHLIHDRDRAPHILFLADASASMPPAFIGNGPQGLGSGMQALINSVEIMAKAIHPSAMVTVKSTDSNMWKHLIDNVGSAANLVVYATDGDLAGSPPNPAQIAALGTGPKAIVMDVNAQLEGRRERNGADNIFDAMAQATGGVALNVAVDDMTDVENAIRRILEEQGHDLPYVLSYRAPASATGVRKASVTIEKASGDATYEIGATSAPARKVCALHVIIRIGGHEIRRRLAGQDGRGAMAPDKQDELHGAVLGEHLIALEGPPPSMSTVLDDIITARLSMEKLDKTARDNGKSFNDLLEVLDKGVLTLPKEQAALLMRSAPLSGKDFTFAEQGMRVVLHSQYPILNTDQLVSRVDILPFSQAHVIAPDRDVQLEKAFSASLMLAAGEAALFPVNTGEMLKGKPLAMLTSELYRNQTPPLASDERTAWSAFEWDLQRMFPSGHVALTAADASTRASWVISRATGEVFAVLPDGSGGGQMILRMKQQLAALDRALSLLNLLAMGAGGGVALSVVAAYGQTLARIYAAASMAVLLTDAGGLDSSVRQALAGLACNVTKAFFLDGMSTGGKVAANAVNIFSATENIYGMTGGSSPTFCAV